MSKIILSLCDYTGNWTQPYKDLGYTVILVDPKHSAHNTTDNPVLYPCTVQHFLFHVMDTLKPRVHGILMAPPCTHFTVSGARWWKGKDKDGRTEEGLDTVRYCLWIKDYLKPQWWCMENPVGRLPKLLPITLGKPKMYFNPYEYGDAFSKKTALWGDFNTDLPKSPVEPVYLTASNGDRYSPVMMKTGGKSDKTKELRSVTPMGFARAFAAANP